jgi:mono/diheme cytochrome c family protein/glucose/arabinose dehydrogenase
MSLFHARVVAIAMAVLTAAPQAFQSPAPWAPGLQNVPADSPALDPSAALGTFRLPPGYRIELVASEPLIQDPIFIDWDPDGRLWAIEVPGYMPDIRATTEFAPSGRIVVLEDTDGNGAMDRRTVFLDGLVLPRSLKVLSHGVIVGAPPDLWLVRDTDGDLRGDTKEIISTTYGDRAAGPEHNPNGLLWGLDNWIHTSDHNQIFRLQNGRIVAERILSRGQWGVSMDDAGRIYRNTNQAALFVDLVPSRYYVRQSGPQRTRGLFEPLQNRTVNTVWPIRPTRGVNRGYQNGILRPDGRLAAFTAACAPTVYRGDRLPAELYGNVFVAEPAGNLVSRIDITNRAGSLHAHKPYTNADFLTSTDERFRPVYLSSAPDGTLFVVDFYRGIIQHRTFITEYLRDHIVAHQLEQPTGLGRIYRIVHTSTRRDARPALSAEPAARLVDRLSHSNGWWRDTAQRLLVERGDTSVVPLLRDRVRRARSTRARLHALWTLDGLNGLEDGDVARALEDPSPDVRASAIRLSERWIAQPDHPLQEAVLARLDDADRAVRRQLAATLGMLPVAKRSAALAALLAEHGDDPVTVDAAMSGLAAGERAALAKTTATIGRRGPAAPVAHTATAVVPGPPPACSTCPGARGGPGGGRAFPSGTAGRARLATRDPISAPPAAPPRDPLPPALAERDAFAAGAVIYRAACATCHRLDGNGRDGVALELLGSSLLMGPPGPLVGVALNGTQGATGVMPGLREILTDDQIAGALTYIRHTAGHATPAVDADLVRKIRLRQMSSSPQGVVID